MSKLAVGSLEGLASEGYKITVAAGSKLMPTGSIIQVVSTTKTDAFTTSSSTFTDITGLSATITPSASSSKVLIIATLNMMAADTTISHYRISGGNATTAYIGDAAGSRTRAVFQFQGQNLGNQMFTNVFAFLDSPATTSATTYTVQGRNVNSNTIWVNRTATDTDSSNYARGASTIVVMEVAA